MSEPLTDLPEIWDDPEPIHLWFNLTYANYLVLPRALLQSMPQEWQSRFVRCLAELDAMPFEYEPPYGAAAIGVVVTDLDATAQRHRKSQYGPWCEYCPNGAPWPCDASVLLSQLGEARADMDSRDAVVRDYEAWIEEACTALECKTVFEFKSAGASLTAIRERAEQIANGPSEQEGLVALRILGDAAPAPRESGGWGTSDVHVQSLEQDLDRAEEGLYEAKAVCGRASALLESVLDGAPDSSVVKRVLQHVLYGTALTKPLTDEPTCTCGHKRREHIGGTQACHYGSYVVCQCVKYVARA